LATIYYEAKQTTRSKQKHTNNLIVSTVYIIYK